MFVGSPKTGKINLVSLISGDGSPNIENSNAAENGTKIKPFTNDGVMKYIEKNSKEALHILGGSRSLWKTDEVIACFSIPLPL